MNIPGAVWKKDCAYQGQPVSVHLAPTRVEDSKLALLDFKDR
jgi:hypothetical protein